MISRFGFAAAALAFMATSAFAGHSDRAMRAPELPAYAQECGSCHVAYPAGMLPAASWNRLMRGLPRHFGADASLDDAQVRAIGSWLQQNAGTYKRVDPQPLEDRISGSAWFVRKHRELSDGVWKRASIHSPSNCSACHPRAQQGAFNEHDIRIPR